MTEETDPTTARLRRSSWVRTALLIPMLVGSFLFTLVALVLVASAGTEWGLWLLFPVSAITGVVILTILLSAERLHRRSLTDARLVVDRRGAFVSARVALVIAGARLVGVPLVFALVSLSSGPSSNAVVMLVLTLIDGVVTLAMALWSNARIPAAQAPAGLVRAAAPDQVKALLVLLTIFILPLSMMWATRGLDLPLGPSSTLVWVAQIVSVCSRMLVFITQSQVLGSLQQPADPRPGRLVRPFAVVAVSLTAIYAVVLITAFVAALTTESIAIGSLLPLVAILCIDLAIAAWVVSGIRRMPGRAGQRASV